MYHGGKMITIKFPSEDARLHANRAVCNISAINRAALALSNELLLEGRNRPYNLSQEFERRYNCTILMSETGLIYGVEFNIEFDATMFLLRWS